MSSWIRRSWNTSSGWPLRRGTRPNTASATSPSTSATARARALRSTSSSPVARWPISVAAGTSPVRTYRTSRSMSCAIASCCPSRLSRRRSPPTTSSSGCSRASPCRRSRCRDMSPSAPERRLQRLEWTVVRRLDGLLQGDYRTIFKGQGLDLADIREYAFGDDVRHIDWNVTARLDAPYVREYHEDREINAHFLLDLSPSVDFGTVDRRKRDLLVDFTTVLARLLTRHGNRVGATLYASRVERSIPARGGRVQVLRILSELEKRPRLESSPLTSLSDLLDSGMRGLKRRSLVFVISDFFSAAGWEDRLERVARRHETLAIRLADPREDELPDIGTVILTDSETGEQLRVNTGDQRFRQRFAEAARRREESLNATFARAGVDVLVLRTDEDLVRAIVRFAYWRKKRAGRRAAMGASA